MNKSHSGIRLPLFYLPPVTWWKVFLSHPSEEVFLERFENFPKQTYRNRCYIYGANGLLKLSIPVEHKGSRPYRDIKISYREDWQKDHWKSLKMAYQSSPYFEYYEDELKKIYAEQPEFLFDFNRKALEVLFRCMKLMIPLQFSEEYALNDHADYREKFPAKAERIMLPVYTQVFGEKFGFLSDLSIIDLLCAKGPQTIEYIKNLEKTV